MSLSLWKSVFAVVLLCCAAAASPLRAAEITFDQWYEFQFLGPGTFSFGCTPETCPPGVNSTFAPAPPWTFTASRNVTVTLTDAFLAGDSFSLFDFGSLVGSTPPVRTGTSCGDDPAVCLNDPAMSHLVFMLPPGNHSLTIRADNSPFGGGVAFFRVDPVPEPATLLLLGTGLAGVAAAIRRRRGGGKVKGT